MANKISVTKFVRAIEKFPCLYNYTLPEYSSKEVIDEAWKKIANEMNCSISCCKDKWKNLRNGFCKNLKQRLQSSTGRKRKIYYLYNEMKFVEPYLKPIFQREETESLLIPIEDVNQIVDEDGHSIAAQSEEDIESVVSDNISESIPQTLKKRKIKVESESNEERQMFSDWLPNETINQEDPRRMFLLSLLPDINKLTDTQMLHFKLKVLMFLSDILKESQ